MEHDDNESFWLAEYVKGQVGYVPAAYFMIILDETLHEEESRKEAHEKRTDGTNIGGGGGTGWRQKKYLFGGCDQWMRENLYDLRGRLYSLEDGYKIGQEEGRSSLFTGIKDVACDRESIEDHGKRKGRDHYGSRRDEQRGQGGDNGDCGQVQEFTEEDEGS